MNDELVCWKCGAALGDMPRPLSRYQPCRRCGADLYVCRMCVHYHPQWNNGCREERAESPRSKEAANFCDWFVPRAGALGGAESQSPAARDALTALFGDAPIERPKEGEMNAALDELFSKPTKSGD